MAVRQTNAPTHSCSELIIILHRNKLKYCFPHNNAIHTHLWIVCLRKCERKSLTITNAMRITFQLKSDHLLCAHVFGVRYASICYEAYTRYTYGTSFVHRAHSCPIKLFSINRWNKFNINLNTDGQPFFPATFQWRQIQVHKFCIASGSGGNKKKMRKERQQWRRFEQTGNRLVFESPDTMSRDYEYIIGIRPQNSSHVCLKYPFNLNAEYGREG